MYIVKCFDCPNPAECNHHVVPVSLGGTMTVPLCLECHGKVHGKDFVEAKRLQRVGIDKAKEAGVYQGRVAGANSVNHERIRELVDSGETHASTAKIIGCSTKTVQRVIRS